MPWTSPGVWAIWLLARGCEARGGPRGDAGRRRDDVRRARLSRRPLRRQARATDTLDADSFTARILAALDIKGVVGRSSLPNRGDAPG